MLNQLPSVFSSQQIDRVRTIVNILRSIAPTMRSVWEVFQRGAIQTDVKSPLSATMWP